MTKSSAKAEVTVEAEAIIHKPWHIWTARICYLLLGILGYYYYDHVQYAVDTIYSYLVSTWVYNSVYFETWWATLVYAFLLAFPYVMDKTRGFNKYKIEPKVKWDSAGLKKILIEGVLYCTPLMTLDTFMVKRYKAVGINPSEWSTRGQHWIQETRALPATPPTVLQITIQLLLSFLLYDAIFYIIHFILHKNYWLYKHIHADHHIHDRVFSRVTNQLTVPERIALVLSANQALKTFNSHPMTRTIFVPLFIGWLIENHCGYDLPWTLDKVVPFGLVGGSPAHYKHHAVGTRNYEPFFTYIDKTVRFFQRKSKQSD